MAIFLLARGISDAAATAAAGDVTLAFMLTYGGIPEAYAECPPDSDESPSAIVRRSEVLDARRVDAKMKAALARARLSYERDTCPVHDLDCAWDGLIRFFAALAKPDANVFERGHYVGDEGGDGVRVLTATETSTAHAALVDVSPSERAKVASAVLGGAGTRPGELNPFTGDMRSGEIYGLDGLPGRDAAHAITVWVDRFQGILDEVTARRFGLALRIVL